MTFNFGEYKDWSTLGSRWRAIRAKKSPCGGSLRFVLVPKREVEVALKFYQVALLILTDKKHRYIFTTKFPFFKPRVREMCRSCQTWPAKFGQILLRTDTRLVFCNRKFMRTDIFFTRTTKPICNFANSANRHCKGM